MGRAVGREDLVLVGKDLKEVVGKFVGGCILVEMGLDEDVVDKHLGQADKYQEGLGGKGLHA